jgi:hypothetical protein
LNGYFLSILLFNVFFEVRKDVNANAFDLPIFRLEDQPRLLVINNGQDPGPFGLYIGPRVAFVLADGKMRNKKQ